MTNINLIKGAAALVVASTIAGGAYAGPTAEDLMVRSLGSTDGAGPVVLETFRHAAIELTTEQRAKALECWSAGGCETGTGGSITVAYADGFGENLWRRVTAMEYFMQALTYPEIGEILYSSARGDAAKAISDMRSYIVQDVDVIVMFADHGAALLPTVREATEAGIKVVVHGGTTVGGTPGEDIVSLVSEDFCKMGAAFVNLANDIYEGDADIVYLGGTPGNPQSLAWQTCSDAELEGKDGLNLLGRADTNWTQEGSYAAASSFLSQYDNIDAWFYEYADGFRGAVRAYEAAGRPLDTIVGLRTDERGLFCDWEAANNPNFRIFYASGMNYQSRIALTAAMMSIEGKDVPANVDVPFSLKESKLGLCDPELPDETSVSTAIDDDMLKMMFGN